MAGSTQFFFHHSSIPHKHLRNISCLRVFVKSKLFYAIFWIMKQEQPTFCGISAYSTCLYHPYSPPPAWCPPPPPPFKSAQQVAGRTYPSRLGHSSSFLGRGRSLRLWLLHDKKPPSILMVAWQSYRPPSSTTTSFGLAIWTRVKSTLILSIQTNISVQ